MPDSHAGELPVCYVQLRPDTSITEDELRAFAEAEISERPAWPRHIHIVETVPMTAVGRIFKPILRQDAVERVVQGILDERGLQGDVEVTAGGPRGMSVRVTLADDGDHASSQLQEVLDGHLFGATVET